MATPSTDAHANNGTNTVIVGWSLIALSSSLIALRMYARRSLLRKVAIDDYLMLVSLLSELLHIIFYTVAWTYGLGRHYATLSPAQQQAALMYTIGFVEFFAVTACMWGRLSFVVFLLYIIGPTNKIQRFVLWAIIAVQVIAAVVAVVQIYAQCGTDVTALWDKTAATTADCQSPMVETIIAYVHNALNSACDLLLTILPVRILWRLNMPLGQKIGLGVMLTLSIFDFSASLYKIPHLRALLEQQDFTWYMPLLQIIVCSENNVVMIAATIPTLGPLLRKRNGTTVGSTPPPQPGSRNARRRGFPMHRPTHGRHESTGRSAINNTDGNSEEYILQDLPTAPDQISKSGNVHVMYQGRSQSLERDIEKNEVVPL